MKLKPSGEHRFRRIRDDGELGEEVVFELGAEQTATRVPVGGSARSFVDGTQRPHVHAASQNYAVRGR